MTQCGELYATAARLASLSYGSMRYLDVSEIAAELVASLAAFSLRASAIINEPLVDRWRLRAVPDGLRILRAGS